MKTRQTVALILILIFIGSLTFACTSAGAPLEPDPGEGPSSEMEEIPTNTRLEPTNTAEPTQIPEPTPSPLPTETSPPPTPMLSAPGADLVCRFGPGEEYAISGTFLMGDTAPVMGKSEDLTWVVIEHPRMPGRYCWLKVEQSHLTGDLNAVPISPPPENIILGVTARLEPQTIKLSSCTFPVSFDAFFTLEASGPLTVTYRLVSNEGTSSWRTKTFSSAGSKHFDENFEVDSEGNYYYRVEVSSPNVIQGETTGAVDCP